MRKSPAAFFRTTVHTGGFCFHRRLACTMGRRFKRDVEGDATQLGGTVKGIGVTGQATEARTDMYDVSATCAHDLLI